MTTKTHIVCPACNKPTGEIDHFVDFNKSVKTRWYCDSCMTDLEYNKAIILNNFTEEQYRELFEGPDYDLKLIRAAKKYKLRMDKEVLTEYLTEQLIHASSGEYIGEGYHGGLSCEEWRRRRICLEQCLAELNSINEEN